jgi:hypothetical protein
MPPSSTSEESCRGEVRVNSGFYFKSQKALKSIPKENPWKKQDDKPKMVSCYYSHGSCMCGKTDVDTVVVKMNKIVKYEFWNHKVLESDVFVLGTDCIVRFSEMFK